MRGAVLFSVLVLSRAVAQDAAEIRGTVRSVSGEPIRDAWVGVVAERTVWAQTSATGSFALRANGPGFLVAKADAYRPLLRELKPNSDTVAIALDPADGTELRLRGRLQRGMVPELRLALPLGVKPQIVYDDDYSRTFVYHGSQKKPDAVVLWKGVYVSNGLPLISSFRQHESFEIRGVRCADLTGVDLRARTPDGRLSRWVGVPFNFVEYAHVSADTAKCFDRMIDGMTCK